MFRAINPTTEAPIEELSHDTEALVETRLELAAEAAETWRRTTIGERATRLTAAAELLRTRKTGLARLITVEMGKPITEAEGEIEKCAWLCEYYAEQSERFLESESIATDATDSHIRYDPLGVVLAIMPWNFPFWQVFRFAAPTLMAGNVGLLKHAPSVPGCARAIAEVFAEAEYPEGVFTNLVVPEAAVGILIDDPRVAAVSLTGSLRAGRAVAAMAGRAIKPSLLELGGSDPCIVLDDADLDAAIDGVMLGRFLNCGQSCIADKRLIISERLHDAFVERLIARVDALVVGDPMQDDTQIGPLARQDLRTALATQVDRSVQAGARCLIGGQPLDRPGWFYAPTVLIDVAPGMAVFEEETFGPVAAVTRAADADEALALANRSRFGLGASVYTGDPERALRTIVPRLETGHVAINGVVKSDPRLPFGGVRESGYGRELGRAGLHAFVNAKSVWVR